MTDTNVFDTQEYLDAVTPPVFIHDGRRHAGRVLSWKEWVALLPSLAIVRQGGVVYPRAEAAMAAIVDALFPPVPPDAYIRGPWYAPWRKRAVRLAPTAAEDFLALPFPVQTALLNDFLRSQGAALGAETMTSSASSRSGSAQRPPSGTAPTSPTS